MTTSMQHSSYHLSENTATTDDLEKMRRKVKDLEDENAQLKRKLRKYWGLYIWVSAVN